MYVVWIALIAASAPLTWDRKPTSRAKVLDRYSRTMNVAITPEVETVVIARLVRRERAISVGGLVGLIAAVVVTVFLPGRFGSPVTVLVIAGCVLAGIGISGAVAASVGLALGVLLAGMLTVLVWSFTAKPRQHCWRRLWAVSASASPAASSPSTVAVSA